MSTRYVHVNTKIAPPRVRVKGCLVLLFDHESKRWCVVGRGRQRRDRHIIRFSLLRRLYQRGFEEVYGHH
jgi:hypothetical protein